MTSLNQRAPSGYINSKLRVPNGGLSTQLIVADSPDSSNQNDNPNLLTTATPTQSLRESSESSTQKIEIADGDDSIKPLLKSSSDDFSPKTPRRRGTGRATISERAEALDKSYVFSFGKMLADIHTVTGRVSCTNRP